MTPALCFWIGLCVGAVGGYWIPRLSATWRRHRSIQRRLRRVRGAGR